MGIALALCVFLTLAASWIELLVEAARFVRDLRNRCHHAGEQH